MGKISLPETVKVAKFGFETADQLVNQHKMELALGKNEVAALLGMRVVCDGNSNAAAWQMLWALYRKSDADYMPAQLRMHDYNAESDIIAGGTIVNSYDLQGAAGLGLSRTVPVDDFLFPYPLVIIRPPQFLYQSLGSTAIAGGIFLYYLTQEVTGDTLTKLMVKDHA